MNYQITIDFGANVDAPEVANVLRVINNSILNELGREYGLNGAMVNGRGTLRQPETITRNGEKFAEMWVSEVATLTD